MNRKERDHIVKQMLSSFEDISRLVAEIENTYPIDADIYIEPLRDIEDVLLWVASHANKETAAGQGAADVGAYVPMSHNST